MSKKRRHTCKGQLCFHGAFNSKRDAREKETALRAKGEKPFIRFLVLGPRRQSYVVITRRK